MPDNKPFPLITANLEEHFKSLRKQGVPARLPDGPPPRVSLPRAGSETDYSDPFGRRYGGADTVKGAFGAHTMRREATGGSVSFSQPMFFSPVYTPINWQIPSKRREQYQWERFFYENEPRVAAAVDFYARFPLSPGFELECEDRHVGNYYEHLREELELDRWFRLISHEVHLLGDCFPFMEIECPHCHGSGWVNGTVC